MNEADKSTNLLVSGYIRNMQQIINDQIIPLSIIELCIKFYLSIFKIIFIKQDSAYSSVKLPEIYISEKDYNNHCKINIIKPIETTPKQKCVDLWSHVLYLRNFELPKSILLQYNNIL